MKKLIIISAFILSVSNVFAQTWKADKNHSHLNFTVTHLTINDVDGVFKDFDATITSSKPDFSDAKIQFIAQTASVSTGNDYRDKDLKSDHFFYVEKFPELTFTSKAIKSAGKNHYKVTGNLTLHGVTKPVVFDFFYRGTVENPQSKEPTAGVLVTGAIKRSTFNFGSGFGAPMISDEVTFKAAGEFSKAK